MGLTKDYAPVSDWLKASDVSKGEMVLTITEIGESTFQDGRKQPTLKFEETEKILGLNKTNREKLAELFGDTDPDTGELDVDADTLIGQKIALYKSRTQNPEGATVDCVRIRAPRTVKGTTPAPAQPADVHGNAASVVAANAKAHVAKHREAVPADDDTDPFEDQ